MERKCIFCEAVIDIKKHGLTKFCSATCRNKYYYQNKNQNEQPQPNEVKTEIPINETTSDKSEEIISGNRQQNLPVHDRARNNDSFIYSLIEAKFDAKNESNFYKLKCEQLEELKRKLEQELFDANSELESLESENDGPLSFLSGLPENVIAGVTKAAFENEHMRNIISSLVSSKK